MRYGGYYVRLSALVAAAILATAARGFSPESGTRKDSVLYFPKDRVNAAFAKTEAWHLSDGGNYSVLTAHRNKRGEVEVHRLDTDILYVVDGEATLVTGGSVVGGKTTAPNEERGTAVEGGETYHLSQGDVMIVPKSTPHWFKEVPQQVSYLVVKVR